jgi:hypothetical protein
LIGVLEKLTEKRYENRVFNFFLFVPVPVPLIPETSPREGGGNFERERDRNLESGQFGGFPGLCISV